MGKIQILISIVLVTISKTAYEYFVKRDYLAIEQSSHRYSEEEYQNNKDPITVNRLKCECKTNRVGCFDINHSMSSQYFVAKEDHLCIDPDKRMPVGTSHDKENAELFGKIIYSENNRSLSHYSHKINLICLSEKYRKEYAEKREWINREFVIMPRDIEHRSNLAIMEHVRNKFDFDFCKIIFNGKGIYTHNIKSVVKRKTDCEFLTITNRIIQLFLPVNDLTKHNEKIYDASQTAIQRLMKRKNKYESRGFVINLK